MLQLLPHLLLLFTVSATLFQMQAGRGCRTIVSDTNPVTSNNFWPDARFLADVKTEREFEEAAKKSQTSAPSGVIYISRAGGGGPSNDAHKFGGESLEAQQIGAQIQAIRENLALATSESNFLIQQLLASIPSDLRNQIDQFL